MVEETFERRYFMSYRGVKQLPSIMISPIEEDQLRNRNTYVCAYYDDRGRLRMFEKRVYGEVELTHRYDYDDNGLVRAEVRLADEDAVSLTFAFDTASQTAGADE